jgi:acetylornithine and succinylornithine aminotransferases
MGVQLRADEIFAMSDRWVMHTYGRIKLAFVRGEGSRLFDVEGRSFLDFVSGLAVTSLGHGHPKLKQAIVEAAESLLHTSNYFYILPQAQLAERLAEVTGFDRVFFANSGAEANEAAIKLARRYQVKSGRAGRYEVISAINSFHGRTLATVTATGQPKYHAGFEPLPAGFRYVPLNDLEALRAAITDTTAAVLLEPVQGEGGIHPCTPEYLQGVRALCDQHGLLLILDEVQTGVGRTGTFLAAEQYGVKADICTLAKGLGGGVPIGAMLATEEAAKGFEPGSHASTFGGNFLATRAALAVLDVLFNDGVLERVPQAAQRLWKGLKGLAERHPKVLGEVRGLGLMLGVELKVPGSRFLNGCLEKGLLVNVIGDKVLRLLPPLTVSDEEIDEALRLLELVCEECASECQDSAS